MQTDKVFPAARSIFLVLVRGWAWIVAAAILGGAAALGYSLLEEPTYEADTTVFITSGGTVVPTAYDSVKASEERIASYAQLVYSDAVLAPAVKAAGLELSLTDARAAVSVDLNPQIVMLTIHARDTNPEVAQRLGNALADSMAKVVSQLEIPGSGTEPTAKLSTVTTATVGATPVSPTTEINVILGVAIGLVVGVLLVLTRERLNGKIRDLSDAQAAFQAPGLESLTAPDPMSAASLTDFDTEEASQSAAYRRLRSVLTRSAQKGANRILIASARDSEGTTTLAINLGKALARAGNTTVLVDCNFGDPQITKLTNGTPGPGVTDALNTNGSPSPARVQSNVAGVRGLSILGAGSAISGYPEDLLASPSMGRLLAELGKGFDYVLIDCPSALSGTSVAAISPWIDRVIVVARKGVSTVADLKRCKKQVADAELAPIGIVMFEYEYAPRDSKKTSASA